MGDPGSARRLAKFVANHGPAKLVEAEALALEGDIISLLRPSRPPTAFVRSSYLKVLVEATRACIHGNRLTTAKAFAVTTEDFPKSSAAWELEGDVAVASTAARSAGVDGKARPAKGLPTRTRFGVSSPPSSERQRRRLAQDRRAGRATSPNPGSNTPLFRGPCSPPCCEAAHSLELADVSRRAAVENADIVRTFASYAHCLTESLSRSTTRGDSPGRARRARHRHFRAARSGAASSW